MKNIMFVIATLMTALVIIAAVMGITGRNVREKEETESLSMAMREVIDDLSVTAIYTIDDSDELKADFTEALVEKLRLDGVERVENGDDSVVFGDKKMSLQIDFAKADAENELLMVHVKERFSYAFGIEGVAEDSAVILLSEESGVKLHTIRYSMTYDESRVFNCAPDYKIYEQEENEYIKTPASPTYFEDYDPDNPDSASDEADFNWVCVDSTNESEIAVGEHLTPEEIRSRRVKGDYEFAFEASTAPRRVIAWMNGEKRELYVPYEEDILPYLNSCEPTRRAPLGYTFVGWASASTPAGWNNNSRNAPEDHSIKPGQIRALRSNRNYFAMYAKDSTLSVIYNANGGSPTRTKTYGFRDVAISDRNGSIRTWYYTYNGNADRNCGHIWNTSRYQYMSVQLLGPSTALRAPVRSSYDLLGWSLNRNATVASWGCGSVIAVNSLIAGGGNNTLSVNLYAIWRAQYQLETIYFNVSQPRDLWWAGNVFIPKRVHPSQNITVTITSCSRGLGRQRENGGVYIDLYRFNGFPTVHGTGSTILYDTGVKCVNTDGYSSVTFSGIGVESENTGYFCFGVPDRHLLITEEYRSVSGYITFSAPRL